MTTTAVLARALLSRTHAIGHGDHHLMIAYGNYEILLGIPWSSNLNRPAEARVYGAKCVALARAEVRDDPNDATTKRDLRSLASPVGALRMETSNSPNTPHPSLINIKIHLGDNASYL